MRARKRHINENVVLLERADGEEKIDSGIGSDKTQRVKTQLVLNELLFCCFFITTLKKLH